MRKLEAVPFAFLVEGALVVKDRIDALYAGTSVPQDIEIHRLPTL